VFRDGLRLWQHAAVGCRSKLGGVSALLTTLTCKRRQFNYLVVVKWTRQLDALSLACAIRCRPLERPIAAAAAAVVAMLLIPEIEIYAQRPAQRLAPTVYRIQCYNDKLSGHENVVRMHAG